VRQLSQKLRLCFRLKTSCSIADNLAIAEQDVRYAAGSDAASAVPFTNASTAVRNKWLEVDYAGLARATEKYMAAQHAANGDAESVPLPKLPGNANQTPSRDRDQFFTALVDWVEKGVAPGDIAVSSRNGRLVIPSAFTRNGRHGMAQALLIAQRASPAASRSASCAGHRNRR
jgi:hypothetical protein